MTVAPEGMRFRVDSAGGVEILDNLDAESVLLERDDGCGEGVVVGQGGEAWRSVGDGHCCSWVVGVLSQRNRTLPRLIPAPVE